MPSVVEHADTVRQPEPRIRLCHLYKWKNYAGYGFRLHDDKTKTGHFVGRVEPLSPADLAGLKKGDRLIEVNGASVKDQEHHLVVEKITHNPNEVRLLVLDEKANAYYEECGVWPHGSMPNVERIVCPDDDPRGKTSSRSSMHGSTITSVTPRAKEIKLVSLFNISASDNIFQSLTTLAPAPSKTLMEECSKLQKFFTVLDVEASLPAQWSDGGIFSEPISGRHWSA